MMKRIIYSLTIVISMALGILNAEAQSPGPPPPPGNDPTGGPSGPVGGNGGGAPIEGGSLILITFAVAYGTYKGIQVYQKKKKKLLD